MATKLSIKALERQWARALKATAEINQKLEDIQERKKQKEELKKQKEKEVKPKDVKGKGPQTATRQQIQSRNGGTLWK